MSTIYAELNSEPITLGNGRWAARSRIALVADYRDKDDIKSIPGAGWVNDVWSVPLAWTACHALRSVFGARLVLGPELTAWAQEEIDAWMREAATLRNVEDIPEGEPREYSYQRVGTHWLQLVRYGLLTDEMGTGKTVQAAVALRDLQAAGRLDGPVLIVCPNSVKPVWHHHIQEWAPNLNPFIVGGGMALRRTALKRLDDPELALGAVCIINWESLRIHSRLAPYSSIRLSEKEKTPGELNRHWGAIVADEAHRAKDPKSKQTRALWAASSKASHRWALTGTPIAKQPDDLWSLLHFILPQEWPSKSTFIDRYCLSTFGIWGGMRVTGLNPATEPELRKTLDVRMLRRLKEEVLPDLPAKVYEERLITLTPKEQKAYDLMEEELILELESGDQVIAWNGLARMTRLLQLASGSMCAIEQTAAEAEDPEAVQKFRLCEPSSKLDELMALLEDLGDEPVVVAAVSRQLIEMAEARLTKAGITFGSVHGNVTADQRQRNVDDFQNGRKRVMLLTVAAGGEGITLHKASTIIFLQRPWSMIQNKQAEDRIHRIGQDADHVFVIDLVTEGTAEFNVFDALKDKEDTLEEIVRDKDRLRELLLRGKKPKKTRKKKTETEELTI